MSAIRVAIQRCIDEGWYAELRERAPFWLGDFPPDPPDLQAELKRCAMLPNEDDVPRLRALVAVWQCPPGPPWGSTHLEGAARDRKNAWVNQGLSPTTQAAVSLPPSTVEPSVEPARPMDEAAMDEAALEKLIYPHGRLALLRLTRLLWRYAQRLSTLHRARKHAAINRTLTALARQAGLVERPRRGRRKRLPRQEHLRELKRQTAWLVSKVNEWSSKAEAFVEEIPRLVEVEAKRLAAEAKRIAEEAKRRAGERERLGATVRADSAKIDERLAATETAEVRANLAKMDELGMIALRAEREERIASRSAEWEAYSSNHPQPQPVLVPEEDLAQVADRRACTLSLDDAWAIRFPILTRAERRALVGRDYKRSGRKYSVADWLIARRLGFNATAIRQERQSHGHRRRL